MDFTFLFIFLLFSISLGLFIWIVNRGRKARLAEAAAKANATTPAPPTNKPIPNSPFPACQAADLFISHASADAATAAAIVARLESEGVRCWIAPRDIGPGKSYAAEITRGVKSTQQMVLLLSAASNKSQAVLSELELARRFDKAILPILLEDIQPSDEMLFYISAAHWRNYQTDPQGALEHLKKAIA